MAGSEYTDTLEAGVQKAKSKLDFNHYYSLTQEDSGSHWGRRGWDTSTCHVQNQANGSRGSGVQHSGFYTEAWYYIPPISGSVLPS